MMVLIDAQKILSTVYRTGQRFGSYYVIAVLRLAKSENSRDYNTINCPFWYWQG